MTQSIIVAILSFYCIVVQGTNLLDIKSGGGTRPPRDLRPIIQAVLKRQLAQLVRVINVT